MTGPADGKTIKDADSLEVAPGFAHEKLEGWVPELAGEEEVRQALEKAFDYRGDVTITRKDGSKVEGYVFDRRTGKSLADSAVRLYPKDSRSRERRVGKESRSRWTQDR